MAQGPNSSNSDSGSPQIRISTKQPQKHGRKKSKKWPFLVVSFLLLAGMAGLASVAVYVTMQQIEKSKLAEVDNQDRKEKSSSDEEPSGDSDKEDQKGTSSSESNPLKNSDSKKAGTKTDSSSSLSDANSEKISDLKSGSNAEPDSTSTPDKTMDLDKSPSLPQPMPLPETKPEMKPETKPDSPKLDTALADNTKKAEEEFLNSLVSIFDEKKLLNKKEYPAIRKLFADRFERQHGKELEAGYGEDAADMKKWLEENSEIRDEFYLALDPAHDKLGNAASILNELRKRFPEKIVPYANLAIACAVVWDDPQRGVYDYEQHARRTKSTMPTDLMDMRNNFEYYVDAEPVMEGRIRYVPWEFLVHVVNHKTPKSERTWAMQNFAGRRVMYGKCYSDVPYDHEMLRTQSQVAKLNDKDYTLMNLLAFGGVCAMQADFSSRVGKSVGVSSEYVWGEAAGGERHAWVMWIEIASATPTGINFTLESHGRYRGDKYYVGSLEDPQTGETITDRELELRLRTVGMDTVAKRQAKLVMQAYEQICDQKQLETKDRLNLLSQIVQFSPGCEEAWMAVAKSARDVTGEKEYAKQYQGAMNQLFITFQTIPDFTWKVFGDLAAYYPEGKPRINLYERLIDLYEKADRPDLACEARLAWADMVAAEDRQLEAVQGLAATITKFPGEGRYLPALLDKLELLCKDLKDADTQLVAFYTRVLPLVPQKRGDEPSPFAMKMYERAIGVFTKYNQPALAQAAQAELAKLKASSSKIAP